MGRQAGVLLSQELVVDHVLDRSDAGCPLGDGSLLSMTSLCKPACWAIWLLVYLAARVSLCIASFFRPSD